MTRRLYDAAFPPPDPHLEVCGFYIGGDTPHVWSDQEIAAQSARWRMPIYTCDNPASRDPVADATAASGWMIRHQVPKGSALALDYETAVDGAYVTAFDRVVSGMGWTLLLYGSLSSVVKNPRPSAGYWTASWTTVPHLDAGAAATQWASDTQLGRPYDLSEVSDSLVLWDTQGETVTIEWTDTIEGPNGRPNGNTVANILTDLGRFRDALFGDPTALAAYPEGSPLRQLLALAEASVPTELTAIESHVAELVSPTVDSAAVAAALAGNTAFVQAIASAVVAQIGADLKAAG